MIEHDLRHVTGQRHRATRHDVRHCAVDYDSWLSIAIVAKESTRDKILWTSSTKVNISMSHYINIPILACSGTSLLLPQSDSRALMEMQAGTSTPNVKIEMNSSMSLLSVKYNYCGLRRRLRRVSCL